MPIPENIIQRAADCSVRQFMQCSFDDKLKVLIIEGEATESDLKAAFEYIYAEYVDYSDLYQSQEFEMVAYINSLDTRIQTIRRFLDLQRKFVYQFDCPYINGFGIVKKYGHHIYWDWSYDNASAREAFLKKLTQIEMKEKKYETKVDQKVTELFELRKKKVQKIHTILEQRKDFVTMLTRLQKAGFVIDKDKTSVEELALIIKDQRDQVEEAKMQNKIKRTRG